MVRNYGAATKEGRKEYQDKTNDNIDVEYFRGNNRSNFVSDTIVG